ncbi:uncharacterized protein LOC136092721 [Hydra vulgaris]|uniref:uncharacterized protein LOC136092721 n=1 Tax=Hydra vulgaris TaxID=6087 RepID=UPI0032E9E9BA
MADHLLLNNLLSPHQHGFVKLKSHTNLLEVLDIIITEALSDGCAVLLILLDFAKAFDSVSHHLLQLKLVGYGYCTKIIVWLKDFLSKRKLRVVLHEVCSDWTEALTNYCNYKVTSSVTEPEF